VDAQEELPPCVLDAATCTRESEYQTRRIARNLRTRDAKCTGFDGGIFGTFIAKCNFFSFKHSIKINLTACACPFALAFTVLLYICKFKQLHPGNHSELETYSYELFSQ